MLVFLDLETEGLSSTDDAILEVAAIITDDKFNEVATYQAVVQGKKEFYQLPEVVRDMHTKNGLWAELRSRRISAVDWELAECIRKHAVKIVKNDKGSFVDRPQLAGNTISFDRAFMKVGLPNSEAELHYRNLDVSSINEMARRFWPTVWEGRPKGDRDACHRAMYDARQSLETAKYYAKALGPAFVLPVQVQIAAVPGPDWMLK